MRTKNSPPKKGVAVLCRVVLVKEWTSGNYQASSSSSLHSGHNVAKTIMKLQINFQETIILWYVLQTKNCKNEKDFCLTINIPTGNYWILRIDAAVSCQKLGIILLIKWFKNWCYQKILIHNKKCAPKLVFLNEKIEKDSDDFWHFSTPPHYTSSQHSTISFGYVDSYAKLFLILSPRLKTPQPVLP